MFQSTMDQFIRRFAVNQLADHCHSRGLAALFECWVLPGEDAGTHGLRVAIRNGYLNFYVKGQSVGELRLVSGWPRLKLHRKYKECADSGSERARDLGQKYEVVNADSLMATGPDIINGWIHAAQTYAGDEKRFVDDLVAVTPGTLDQEMGLPADEDAVGRDRTAPRMDLVVAQGTDIAFWEAKCGVNAELRARAAYRESPDGSYDVGPHVIWQLRRYERWVGRPRRRQEVRDAYVATAKILLELAELFGKRGQAIDAWKALAGAGRDARVILPPGIVVADYCPTRVDGAARPESASYQAKAASFDAHEARLLRHGATIKKVASKASGPILPTLHPGSIRDIEQLA
jgi:hypothetical protein